MHLPMMGITYFNHRNTQGEANPSTLPDPSMGVTMPQMYASSIVMLPCKLLQPDPPTIVAGSMASGKSPKMINSQCFPALTKADLYWAETLVVSTCKLKAKLGGNVVGACMGAWVGTHMGQGVGQVVGCSDGIKDTVGLCKVVGSDEGASDIDGGMDIVGAMEGANVSRSQQRPHSHLMGRKMQLKRMHHLTQVPILTSM